MNTTNANIATRLILAFGSIMLCLFLCMSMAVWQLSDLKTFSQTSIATNFPSIQKSHDILESSWKIELSLRDIALANQAAYAEKEIPQINARLLEINDTLDQFAKLAHDAEGKRLLKNMLDARMKYVVGVEQILQRYSEDRKALGIGLILLNFREVQQEYAQSIKAYTQYHTTKLIAANKQTDDVYANASNWLVGTMGCATVLSIIFSYYLSRTAIAPITPTVSPATSPTSTEKGWADAANEQPVHLEASIDLKAEKDWPNIRNKDQHVGPDDLLEDARCIAISAIHQAKRSARKSSGSATSL